MITKFCIFVLVRLCCRMCLTIYRLLVITLSKVRGRRLLCQRSSRGTLKLQLPTATAVMSQTSQPWLPVHNWEKSQNLRYTHIYSHIHSQYLSECRYLRVCVCVLQVEQKAEAPLMGVVVCVSKKLSKKQSELNAVAASLGADFRYIKKIQISESN